MKRAHALLVGVLLAAAGLGAWWLSGARGGEARQADSVDSPAAAERDDTALGLAAAELEGVRAQAASDPSASGGAASGAAPTTTFAARLARAEPDVRRVHVFARVEDPQGAPIAGAALLSPPDDPTAVLARTDAEGRFDAELELAVDRPPLAAFHPRDRLSASVFAAGFTARNVELDTRQGARFHLGTLVLVPGVPVSGRVVDRTGHGVADGSVEWYPAAQLAMLREEIGEEGYPFDFMMPRDDPSFADLALGARSATDGSFHLLGVPREQGLLAALADGHGLGLTDALSLDSGELRDVRIELPDGQASAPLPRVVGTVVQPDGAPHPGATVTLHVPDGGIRGFDRSGQDGGFEILLHAFPGMPVDPGPYTVRAIDPEQRFSAGEVSGVLPDGPEVVVQLAAARLIEVRLVDRDGASVPWGHVRSDDADEPWPLTALGPEGRGSFLLPSKGFTVETFAPGFRTEVFGPFDPALAEAVLELRLTPGESVRGRIVADGRPIEGARVALTRTSFPAGVVGRARNVAPRDRPFDIVAFARLEAPDATSAPDGTFVATLHSDGWFTVAAEAEGYARCVVGPFQWTQAEGASGLVLELERPGAIEGRVLVPNGESAEGRLVAASNGLGEAWIAAADAQGRFRIGGLTPGGWQLRPGVPPLGEREPLEQSGVSTSVRDVRYDLTVSAGATASAVLDLASGPEYILHGRLRLDDAGLAGAPVELHPGDLTGRADDHSLASALVADDGGFELRLGSGGPVILSITGDGGLLVLQPLDLQPGVTPWELDLQSAALALSGSLPKVPGEGRTLYLLRTRLPGGAFAFRRGMPKAAAGEPLRLEQVPAGEVELLFASFPEGIERGYLDDSAWTRAATIHLEPGRETALELP